MAIDKASFPLYTNDGRPCGKLTVQQEQGIRALEQAVAENKLRLVENRCLCGCPPSKDDIVVSEKDRYGLPVPQILCAKCGLIRSGKVFDEASNNLFYQAYYRDIYSTHTPTERFFDDQIATGRRFLDLLQRFVKLDDVHRVAEVGCGAGGILLPFREAGMETDGYDYGETYLKYGRTKGLSLHQGDFYQLAEDESTDLVILSHVLEHFLDPVLEVRRILRKIRPGGYLLVEVPGIFHIHASYVVILDYFQNAHVYNFSQCHLKALFESLGLDVVYGDERCTFICQKRKNAAAAPVVWPEASEQVAAYLLDTKRQYWKWKGMEILRWIRHRCVLVANVFGWQKIKQKLNRR